MSYLFDLSRQTVTGVAVTWSLHFIVDAHVIQEIVRTYELSKFLCIIIEIE